MIINSVNYSQGGGELEYIPITTYAELISAFATSNDKPLRLMNDLTATAEITTTSTNTLDLHGHTITGTNSFRFMTISSGGNVTLCDLSVDGGGTITTFKDESDNCGGCMYVTGGTLTMTGGSITNCTAYGGGGVEISSSGLFNMSGNAVISYCNANDPGIGWYGSGGGVDNYRGIFNMSGNAQITHCSATNGGGGVESFREFNMTGDASISYCNVKYGGGVRVNSGGTFNMSDNAVISYCEATGVDGSGGGVYVKYNANAFIMSGGIICMNTASTTNGGVYGTYTKTGGYVGGNTPQE